jgi:hypothetical protein
MKPRVTHPGAKTLARLRPHLTYANVMVTLLAFIVIAGGSAAAAVVISSNSQVARDTISGHHPPADQHANLIAGSVAAKDLAGDSVNGSKVLDESLTGADVKDFRLTNQDTGVLFAQVDADGTLARSSGGVTSTNIGDGRYDVDFGRDVSSCAFVAGQGEAEGGGAQGAIVGATDRTGEPNAVFVRTKDADGVETDTPFQLVVVC